VSGFTLAAYEQEMDRQAIHMDQGLAWCPEFRATRSMVDYPSRKAELVRALHRGEVPPSERAARILFHSILSRQGERWQVFKEPADGLTDLLILGRQALLKKGFGGQAAADLLQRLGGGASRPGQWQHDAWQRGTSPSRQRSDWLLLDEASAAAAAPSAGRVGSLLRRAGIRVAGEIEPAGSLWDLFACGLVEEGMERARAQIRGLQEKGIKRIVTLSGQGTYLWRYFLQKVGVEHPFAVLDILELARRLETARRDLTPAFPYAGSFRARYLMQAGLINRLAPGGRAKAVDIWEKPLCAEFLAAGLPRETEELIFADAAEEIRSSGSPRLIVFEPCAFLRLREAGLGAEVVYFTETLA
jgi:hypothetical protein